MSIYTPVTLGAGLTLTGGSGSLSFYSNLTESAQSSLTINRSGSTYLYGANSYSGGTTNVGTGGYSLYVNNGSLGSGPLYVNNSGTLSLYAITSGSLNLTNPIICVTNTGASAVVLSVKNSMNISTFSNLTPVVGGSMTNFLQIGGAALTATITNANYNGSFTVGSSGAAGANVTVAGNFTNTLVNTVQGGSTLNIAGNMAQINNASSGCGFTININGNGSGIINLQPSASLTNAGSFSIAGIANMAGTWADGTIPPTVSSNGLLNISGNAYLAGGFYVKLGGTATVSGIVTNVGTIFIASDTNLASVVAQGASLMVYSNGIINAMNTGTLTINSNGIVQVAGLIANTKFNAYGGTLQLSDGTNAGTVVISATFQAVATTNSSVIGGAPLPGTLMVSNTSPIFPANFTLGGPGTYANNLNLVMVGASQTLTLNDTNTYTGATIISSGTLQLGASGSISNTAVISIGNGATFDVSLLGANTFTLKTGQVLSNSAASTGLIKGSLNTGNGTNYVSYSSGTPAFKVTSGTNTLAASTGFYINNTGSALLPGNYLIIATNGGTTAVAGTAPSTVTVNGNSLAGTSTAALSIITNQLYLVVTTNTTTTLSALTASTYGQTVTFTATVSPLPNGGTIQFYTNGTAISGAVAVNIGTGQASYTTSTLNAGSYSISATFGGTANYTTSTTASALTQTVARQTPVAQALPVVSGIIFGQTLTNSTLTPGTFTNAAGGTVTGSSGFVDLTIKPVGAGSTNVQVIFLPANANYNNLTNTVSVTVAQALLTITANATNKVYDGVAFSGGNGVTYSSFVNGETNTVLVGTLIYSGTSQGATNVGSYPITPSGLTNANYAITFNDGTLTISKAGYFVGASSTMNPSGYRDTVSYTATLPADATGNVVFSSPGGDFSTNTVTGSSTSSLSLTNLPRGTNLITVAYSGDGNYLGSTNMLNQIVTNHPPVVNNASYTRNAALNQIKMAVTNLLSNVTDVDGDTLTLASVSATTNTATLIVSGGWVMYYNTNAVADEFTYTVSDGFGGTNSATVNITVDSTPLFGQVTLPAVDTTSGTATLNFAGIPTYSYSVMRSTNLTAWAAIWETNAPGSGVFQFIDLTAPQPSAYYQLRYNQ